MSGYGYGGSLENIRNFFTAVSGTDSRLISGRVSGAVHGAVDGLVSVTASEMAYRNSLGSEPSGLETTFEVVP